LRRKLSACSGAVENFKSPKHHDDGRYQRGRHQHTFQGSDSHPLYSPLPSPAGGLVDSRNRLQSFGHNPIKVVSRLWFAGHSGEHGVPLKEKACEGPFLPPSKVARHCNAEERHRSRAGAGHYPWAACRQTPMRFSVQALPRPVMSDSAANQIHCGRSLWARKADEPRHRSDGKAAARTIKPACGISPLNASLLRALRQRDCADRH